MTAFTDDCDILYPNIPKMLPFHSVIHIKVINILNILFLNPSSKSPVYFSFLTHLSSVHITDTRYKIVDTEYHKGLAVGESLSFSFSGLEDNLNCIRVTVSQGAFPAS